MTPTLILRPDALARALQELPALHIAVLGRILTQVEPTTGRLFGTLPRLSERFKLSEALTSHALRGLEDAQVLTVRRDRSGVLTIELGSIFVRQVPPPENLPLDSV